MNGSSEPNDFMLFGEGISAACILLAVEFLIFVYESVMKLLPTISENLHTTSSSNQILSNFSGFIALFLIVVIVQNFLIGFFARKSFVFGFLIGNGVFLVPLYIYVRDIIPSVVYGMAIAFLIVLGCLIIRLHLEKPKYNPWEF